MQEPLYWIGRRALTAAGPRRARGGKESVMTPFLLARAALLLGVVGFASAAPQRVVFEGAESEHKWALKDLNPDLPSD